MEEIFRPETFESKRTTQIITYRINQTTNHFQLSNVDWVREGLREIKILEIQVFFSNNFNPETDGFITLQMGIPIVKPFDIEVDDEGVVRHIDDDMVKLFLENFTPATKMAWTRYTYPLSLKCTETSTIRSFIRPILTTENSSQVIESFRIVFEANYINTSN